MRGPDRAAVLRAFHRAAPTYASKDFLHAEIRARLLERLDPVRLEPHTVLDLGAGPPAASGAFAARFPGSHLIAIDAVPAMLGAAPQGWSRLCADAARLPLPDACADVAVANMLLPWCADPLAVLAEARRVLRYPGLFAFATLGPDSLQELRTAWSRVDSHSHTHSFIDMHDLGDALIHAGFAEPVLDIEKLTITYRGLDRLVADLRDVGATDLSEGRRRTLTGAGRWSAMTQAYDQLRDETGTLPVTVEVVFGQAWTGERMANLRDPTGGIAVPLGQIMRRR